nr:MAG TPA: hypothetical protein [Caudoviricetes sp.]
MRVCARIRKGVVRQGNAMQRLCDDRIARQRLSSAGLCDAEQRRSRAVKRNGEARQRSAKALLGDAENSDGT